MTRRGLTNIGIRQVGKPDIGEFLQVERDAFEEGSNTEAILNSGVPHVAYAAYDGSGIVGGLVAIRQRGGPGVWNVFSLFVLKGHRRRGIADMLVDKFMRTVTKGSVTAMASFDTMPIFRKRGFRVTMYGMELDL